MLALNLVAASQVSRHQLLHLGARWVAYVAEHDERISPQVAGLAPWDILRAKGFHQCLVIERKKLRYFDARYT